MKKRKFILLVLVAGISLVGNIVVSAQSHDQKTGFIVATNVNLRQDPELNSPIITTLSGYQAVEILSENDLWYKIDLGDNHIGWIYKAYIATKNQEVASRSSSLRYLTSQVVTFAKKFLNVRYVYGGTTPKGFDCSGFTSFVYSQFGLALPHRSWEQMNVGIPIAKENLLPADLVFFIPPGASKANHVGIYIGSGLFIHAASGSRVVRIDALSESYYLNRYLGARRIISGFTSPPQYLSKL